MKSFWKKKLPSFLLALLMMVSLVPAVGAANANITYEVEAGEKITFDAADFSEFKAFDYLVFTDYSKLDSFGNLVGYDKNGGKVTIQQKDLDTLWFYYDEDDIKFRNDCDLDTLSFVADSSARGTLTLSFDLYKDDAKQFSGSLAIQVRTTSSGSSKGDLTYKVAPGGKLTFDAADFSALKSFDYLEFTEYSKLDSFGSFTASDKDGDKLTLAKKDLKDLWLYCDEDDIEYPGDCDLDTLTFVADKDASGTLSLTFALYKNDNKVYTGTLEIKVGKATSSSSADVTYQVAHGEDVTFDAADFSALKSFDYLVFTEYDQLDDFGKFIAYDKDNDQVSLDEDALDDLWFYYDEDDIKYPSDCDLDTLVFAASKKADDGILSLTFELWKDDEKKYTGSLDIEVGNVASSSADIVYTVEEDDSVSFDPDDFKKLFQKTHSGSFSHIRFTKIENLDECGFLTTYAYNSSDDDWDKVSLDEAKALDGYFFYDDDDVKDVDNCYCLDGLDFESDNKTDGEVVSLEFTAYGVTSSKKVDGTVRIEIGDVDNSSSSDSKKADIEYTTETDEEVEFDEDDFYDFFSKSYDNYDLKYVVFTDSDNLTSSNGSLYYKYGRSSEIRFSATTLDEFSFYYDDDEMPEDDDTCYPLDNLSFVAGKKFSTPVTLEFTAYYSSSKKVDGTLTISPTSSSETPSVSNIAANILYTSTTGTNVQLKANDFVRFYESVVSNSTLKSVKLLAVPSVGGLYYNYYSKSPYGTSARYQLTANNCGNQALYPSPSSTAEYSLTELTYVPASNTTNYTVSIPFSATGTGNHTVYGIVMISVTAKAIPEVYGVTPKNSSVSFPAPSISSAVKSGTSATLAKIQLLELPDSKVGTIYVGNGTTRKATISDLYGVSGSTWAINQLRFVPATGYTGNVAIPYLAYDANDKTIGVGTFSLGIVSKQVKFSDITASTWCYKYVAELSDANVISGYTDGTFKPDNTITYGAALKLIMLAAGYGEQAPTVKGSTFSGYLDKARAEGIVTRSNVNLSGPITRLQVAQLAAGALDLDLDNLSSVAPFTDTTDKHVQALNAAGIVEGYFSNGTSTYKPGNTLTRGQVSAIVWRMLNYQ